MNGKYLASLLFAVLSVLGSLYLLAEAVLQSFGRSICATEGCKVVAQYARFGDRSMVLLGLAVLVLLAVLAVRGLRHAGERRETLIDHLLIVALAGEGFFAGYQLLWVRAVCVFCLSVLGIFVSLGLLRVLAGRRAVITGFLVLVAVLSSFTLLLPAGGSAIPVNAKHVLFYSPDCKHCAEIKKEIETQQLDVLQVEVRAYAPTLKSLGIEHVPTLLVNGPFEKSFLTGREAISRYLASCRVADAVTAPLPAGTNMSPGSSQAVPLLSIPDLGAAGQLFPPGTDEGLCKEDVKCE